MTTPARLLSVCLLCLSAWCAVAPAQAEVIELRRAQAELNVSGAAVSSEVSLPYGWDYRHPGQSGVGRFIMTFNGPSDIKQLWAIYFVRLGNAYEVWLNGELLEKNGELGLSGTSDFAKEPRLLIIPTGLLQAHNRLELAIRADIGRRSGVPVVLLGPKDEVEDRTKLEMDVRLASSVVVTVFSLIFGLFAIVLWVTQTDPRPNQRQTHDNLYLFAALAELSWAFFIGDVFFNKPPFAWVWWAMAVNMALGIWLSSLLLFIHSVAGWEGHKIHLWLRWALIGLLVCEPAVIYLAIGHQTLWLLKVWLGCFACMFLPSTLVFVGKAVRSNNTMHRLVALAFVVNVPMGIRDWYVIRLTDSFGSHGMLRYSAVLFGVALAAIVIDRFRAANVRVREMMGTLSLRIEQKEQELGRTYERMELIAREQERASERARILRDMHDGVGAHISAAIRQLQSGKASNEQLLQTLRESLDQLKLSIDAINLPAGDITAMLANLRYRLEPRFKASDIELQWDVNLIEPIARLDDKAMRQLQFMVFEALSNVLQHAHASVLRIELRGTTGGGAQLRVIDNGCGFDLQRVHSRGLASLRERAAAIGARLEVSSAPGRTVVKIALD
jgi:signal transduction histidine kinase